MTDINEFGRNDELLLAYDIPEALESAAGAINERAGALTLAFCSGLDTCPS